MADTAASEVEYLTQDAYDRLKAELEERRTTGREEITKRIEEARSHGDLRENAEYHAAKEEQGLNEDRIRTLEERLRNAKVGAADVKSGVVGQGSVVTVETDGDVEEIFLGSVDDQPEGLDVVSASSPMGRALLGAKVGQTVTYTGPNGQEYEVTVKDVRSL